MVSLSSLSKKTCAVLGTVLCASGPVGTAWANQQIVDGSLPNAKSVQKNSDIGFSNGSFIAVPIPFSNPAIGAGLALGGGYLFELAPGRDTSFLGFGAMRSDNGSEAFGGAVSLSFASGWDFDLTVAEADIEYDLFFGSFKLPIEQDGLLANTGLDYQVTETISWGATFRYLDTQIRLTRSGDLIPPELLPDLNLEILSFGGRFNWDTRDDSDYPTDGSRLGVAANVATITNGSRDYSFSWANFDHYRTLRENGVLATRVSACAAASGAPFFDQCSIGFTDAFRGFSPTQFYDSRLISTQIEYRQRLGSRFGIVTFGGIGWTGPSFSRLDEGGEHAAIGIGARYRLSKQFPIDFSVDVSTNNDGEDYLYIFAGQRF